jgi:hypothetical protein
VLLDGNLGQVNGVGQFLRRQVRRIGIKQCEASRIVDRIPGG